MYYYQLAFNLPLNQTFTYVSEHVLVLHSRVEVFFGSRKLTALVESITLKTHVDALLKKNITIKPIIRCLDTQAVLYEDQVQLARWMSTYYFASLGQCIFAMLPISKKEKEHNLPTYMVSQFTQKTPTLTDEQNYSIKTIVDCAFSNKVTNGTKNYTVNTQHHFYLYGLTGSGKTEVFLQTAKIFMERGTQAIYLVPEISLTQQLYPLFCMRFGADNTAIFHSGLTKSQRLKEWTRIMSGQAKIILGVRSAVFVPVKKLGIIFIDEEHDSSYKSNITPRYNARQVAFKRSILCNKSNKKSNHVLKNVPIVMGSATPSLESWHYIIQKQCTLLRLTKRVAGGELPDIQITSLNNTTGCISIMLAEHIKTTLKAGFQVLLLLNKRGYSRNFVCTHCGLVMECPNCSVNLVFHKVNTGTSLYTTLQCHHCGYKKDAPKACPKCAYTSLGIKGWGTQRVEAEVKNLFPHYVTKRYDSDVLKDKKEAEHILKSFYEQKTHILVGTQMIAKGVNFPNLQLVGILCADSLFALPDFRSSERAHSLLVQAAGRAGRFLKGGKVIIQTYAKEHPSLEFLVDKSQDDFYIQELQRRKDFSLVPYCRMLRIVFRATQENSVEQISQEFVSLFTKNADLNFGAVNTDYTVWGPAPCALYKIAKNYRIHIILSAQTQKRLITLVQHVLDTSDIKKRAAAKKVYLEIDPDPQSTM